MALNIQELFAAWVREIGKEVALAKINGLGKRQYKVSVVDDWITGRAWPPGWVVQCMFDDTERRLETWDHTLPWEGEKLRIATPIYRDIHPLTFRHLTIMRRRHGDKVGFDMERGTIIDEARNRLATRFLESTADWLLFIDDDMVPPCGFAGELHNAGARFNARYMEMDTIARLVSHQKTLVGALYFDRHGKGIPMYCEGRNDAKEAEHARNGPYDICKQTEWIGTGCMLIHRIVFQNILETQVEVRSSNPKAVPHGFFSAIGAHVGEDVSFCRRAAAAGHKAYVDMGCIAGHVGEFVFFNKKMI